MTLGVAVLALVVGGLVFWRLQSSKQTEADAAPGRALVTLAPVEAAVIDDTVAGYGVIGAEPGAGRTVAAPRAVIVTRVFAAAGQPAAAGAPLVEVADAPATELAYQQAASAVSFARRDLDRVQRLYDEKLAASDQLDAARKALADAQAAAAAQTRIGAGGAHQILSAPVSGTVTQTPVSVGEHVAADAPLVTLVAANGLVAQFSVEPEQARRIAPGQTAHVRSSFDPGLGMDGQVLMVGRQVDPTTRQTLVSARVGGQGLALGAAVRAEVVVARHSGLRAPRECVVDDEAGAHVFVVRGGVAHLVPVRPGAEQGGFVEITGALRAGEVLARTGAYQLQDGWPVRTGEP